MRILDMSALPSVDALVFRVRCGWYDVVGEGNFGLATREEDGGMTPVDLATDCLSELRRATALVILAEARVSDVPPHVALLPSQPGMSAMTRMVDRFPVRMRCGFAYGTGQWRVEITDTEGMALADLDLLSDIHLALALNADAGDGPDGADAGAGEEEEEEAPARRHTAQTAAAAASSAADSGGQQTTRPRPSAPPLGAAGAATGDEEAGALSTRAALLSIGIEPQDLDRALAQLGEDADPGATLDAIESLSVAMALAAPPTLRRQRTGEDGRRPMPAVVDGMNVAVGAGRGLLFVGGALRRACDTLLQLGCTPVHVVLPQAQIDEAHRLIRGHEPRLLRFPLTNAEEVVALEREGFIIPAPPTARSRASYDDLLVIDVALQLDALVVSCDKYRDLRQGHKGVDKFLKTRRVPFSAAGCQVFSLQADPQGRSGPTLGDMLREEPDPSRWASARLEWMRGDPQS